VSNWIAAALRLSPLSRADLLIAAPKAVQAIFAALGDYFTWKLGRRVYGAGSDNAWAVVRIFV
jgi:phosphatidylinositol glycan class B